MHCYNLDGAPAAHPYTISVAGGGAERGNRVTLVTGRISTAGVKVPGVQSSSVGGTATVQRLAKGSYRLALPKLPGSGPDNLQVGALDRSFAVCGIAGRAVTANGAVQQVDVTCRGPLTSGPRDSGLDVTYARSIGLLGSNALSAAYAAVPQSTAPSRTLTAAQAFNHYGRTSGTPTSNGSTTVLRSGPGRYVVKLANQQAGGPAHQTATVTPLGSTATCSVLDSSVAPGRQDLSISCENNLGQLTDTAFDLSYSTFQ